MTLFGLFIAIYTLILYTLEQEFLHRHKIKIFLYLIEKFFYIDTIYIIFPLFINLAAVLKHFFC